MDALARYPMETRQARSTRPQLLTRRELDGRTGAAKLFDPLVTGIEADLGGSDQLSTIERALVEAFAGAAVTLHNLNTRPIRAACRRQRMSVRRGVYTRSNGVWSQQTKLLYNNAVGTAKQVLLRRAVLRRQHRHRGHALALRCRHQPRHLSFAALGRLFPRIRWREPKHTSEEENNKRFAPLSFDEYRFKPLWSWYKDRTVMTDFLEVLTTADGLAALFRVMMIDLVLAGDNAVVIGLAASGLPAERRGRAILIGIVAATILRMVFAAFTIRLLEIIGLMLAGGILLLWVCWKMWRELEHSRRAASMDAAGAAKQKTLLRAAWQIIVADVSMSLDNVLALAGSAREHPAALVFGLGLSIVLMGGAASLVARLLERQRWIAYLGLAIIVYVAGDMIYRGFLEVRAAFS
jgi:YjbE family integral membrane protein